ncbi:MAG: aromatic amino acid transport family protein [Candidatus Omnitrophota bacterium]
MKQKIPFIKIFTNSLLVTGMTIGAGILGLPIKTGIAGVLPSLLSMFLVWLLMLCTATVFIYKFTHPKTRSRDYPTLFQAELGSKGKWISVFGYLVNYYGILVAYLTGSAAILVTLVPLNLTAQMWMVAFFIIFTGMALLGADRAKNANAVIMVAMIGSFAALLFMAGKDIDVSRYAHKDWGLVPSVIPIIIVAFAFHNVVPFICRNLGGDQKASFKAVLLGSSIAMVMNILWMLVVVGALPLDGHGKATILGALRHDYPATIPLALALGSRMITAVGMFFALAAIATSYIPTSVALKGFMRGILALYVKKPNKYAVLLLAFGPPFLVAMIYPGIFLKAVDVAGGFGILIVFGILPSFIMIKLAMGRGKLLKVMAAIMIICFSALLVCEIAQEVGVLKLDASKEYWKHKTEG